MNALFTSILLFVWDFYLTREKYGDETITDEGLQILIYARNYGHWAVRVLWYSTGHPFIMVIDEDLRHSHLLLSVWQWNCYYLFKRLESFVAGIRTPKFPIAGRTPITAVEYFWGIYNWHYMSKSHHIAIWDEHIYVNVEMLQSLFFWMN